jgi:SAM-dependent methyltransferase
MTSKQSNGEQIERWAGIEGDHWVRNAERHDRMLAPFAGRLAAGAALAPGQRVLDIGCGCGTTTVDAASGVGETGDVLGVDLSPQMLEVARARAEAAQVSAWARFEVADAQTADFGAGRFDLALSRFGVMFFDDPLVAFTNVAGTLTPGGRLLFCCWQELGKNDWMLVPGLAAAEHVPLPELATGVEPGPFSLADPDRIRSLLTRAGFTHVQIEPFTTTVLLGGGGSVAETLEYMVSSGSGRALLDGVDDQARAAAIAAVRAAFEPHHDGEGVRLGAAAWIVTATARLTPKGRRFESVSRSR